MLFNRRGGVPRRSHVYTPRPFMVHGLLVSSVRVMIRAALPLLPITRPHEISRSKPSRDSDRVCMALSKRITKIRSFFDLLVRVTFPVPLRTRDLDSVLPLYNTYYYYTGQRPDPRP